MKKRIKTHNKFTHGQVLNLRDSAVERCCRSQSLRNMAYIAEKGSKAK